MKYTKFEFKPSERAKKGRKRRYRFWATFAVAYVAMRVTFLREEDDNIPVLVTWNLIYFALIVPAVGWWWDTRKERRDQRVEFKRAEQQY